ncbi:uncharacterized protein IL334_001798 [Kwoniella shivajii]|uniref:Guanyl nucleotide binding protein n=1 Tax=Kwoniella shivajii TaxID=564305 RepID=A0ABZ1CU39_9TREE|nr:hypothetical protein IL334_001798 [Kwoniella shivajii]
MEESITSGPSQQWPSAPVYDFEQNPRYVSSINADEHEEDVRGNFWRSARWCPDGSAILSTTEDRSIRIHTTNEDFSLSTKTFNQPDSIHSTLWYPSATTHTPETFCFLASVRDTPVRLIDGNDGRVRASYPIVDHRERFIGPHSLAFNSTATKLYCGYENAIEVFDVASPGYDQGERLKLVYAKKEKGGQKGIISAISFCPDYSGTFAAGSFSGSVSLYSEDTGSTPVSHVEGVQGGGVTQIGWHPLNPTIMFIASRRSSQIQIYDTRDLSAPLSSFTRDNSTNQRMAFDLDPWGRWLSSGDEFGTIKVWDITTMDPIPIFEENLHRDAVGSVQFHPYQSLLLTCSGSRKHLTNRHHLSDDESSTSGSDDETDSNEDDDSINAIHQAVTRTPPKPLDATLRIWSVSPSSKSSNLEQSFESHAITQAEAVITSSLQTTPTSPTPTS